MINYLIFMTFLISLATGNVIACLLAGILIPILLMIKFWIIIPLARKKADKRGDFGTYEEYLEVEDY